MSANITQAEPPNSLVGVPGIGAVRRRLLEEAGIMTRTALAQASPEQLVSLTGMPRAIAEKVLATLALADDPAVVPEAFPEEGRGNNEADASGEEAPLLTRLERAALDAQTALADASRHVSPGSKLGETLLRFARLADELPRRVSPRTSGGVLKRITLRLQNITERLKTLAQSKRGEPLSEKRAKRLEQRLKRTRDTIKRTLKSNADSASRKLPASSPS